MRTHRLLLTVSILLMSFASASAQQVSSDAANQLFVAGKYREAIPAYTQLLERYSEDPTYNYRLGVCYFLSEEDLNAAYRYLKVASTKEVPNKVYYYLGEVCRYLYRFDESLSYYKRFMVNGGSPDVSTIALELAASAASNGQNLLRYSAKVSPVAKALVGAADFYKTYDTYPLNSGFGEIPADLKTVADGKKGLNSLMFSHVEGGAVGDISVYASYGQNETGSKDLYFIQKVDERTWSRPQRLPSTINSPFDEDYAYMCPDNSTLYFASKGLYSLGGYDIYRATYNADKKEWSTPENMGFPINSPYDDYLFVPSQDGKTACFASKRGVKNENEVAVFKVDGVDNTIRVEVSSETAYAMQALEKKAEPAADTAAVKQQKDAAAGATEGVASLPEYRKIRSALANNEALTDSTSKKMERLRAVWADMPDSTRKDVERLIVFNENKLLELGTIHEQLLNQASALEKDYLNGKVKPDVEVPEKQPVVVNEWFAQNGKLADYFTTPLLEKLAASPLRMRPAMLLVDSLSSIGVQIQDLQQILAAASDSTEKAKVKEKISEFEQSAAPAVKRLNSSWSPFYTAYFDVMSEVAKAVQGAVAEDSSLLQGAQRLYLHAKDFRSKAAAGGDTYSDYQKVATAFIDEQKSLNQLSLYLAHVANEKVISDSLLAALNPSKEVVPSDVVPAGNATSNFGNVKRDNVEIQDIVFSAPTNSGEFAVNTTASYSQQNPMPAIKSLPLGVVYSFQLGLFSQELNYSLFKFSPMFYEVVGGGKRVFAGIFNSYASAQSRIIQVKENGFKDAFIVAFADKKVIPLAKAKTIEARKVTDTKGVSVAPTAMFRVVVGTFAGEMPKNIRDIVEKLLSDKEVIKSPMADGLVSYSIGNFNTFEQAIPLKNKLVSEGVVEAFVTKIELNPNGQ
ncbi:tetratricopeptide repeat protein [uncultured Acetobacteroides sp.]|uniref:tetratricopeptide repeat protein n=1 Tax=uncultured Acetobacteroides sp. TaxID=1760811 RepID=UPI0029F56E5F|nr:tetratricopeptide repeat protein [uncultured Acetobacteroides sp.]